MRNRPIAHLHRLRNKTAVRELTGVNWKCIKLLRNLHVFKHFVHNSPHWDDLRKWRSHYSIGR